MSLEYKHCLDVIIREERMGVGKFQLNHNETWYCIRKDLECPCQEQKETYLPECNALKKIQEGIAKKDHE